MTQENAGAMPEPGLTTVDLRVVLAPLANDVWPLERLLRLCGYYLKGLSMGQIATQMRCEKNVIVGKAHRLVDKGILRGRGQVGGGWSAGRGRTRAAGQTSGLLQGAAQLAHARKVAKVPPSAPVSIPTIAPFPALALPPVAPIVAPAARVTPIALTRPLASRAPPVPEPIARVPVIPPLVRYGRIIECCWPIGEPGTRAFHMCDDPSLPGASYCESHAAKAYIRGRGHAAPMAGTGALLGAP